MAAKKTVETITIKPIVRLRTKIRIVGDTPLITHAWSEKAKRQMLEDQMGGKRVKKRPTKMPFDDFARALHWITPMPTETSEPAIRLCTTATPCVGSFSERTDSSRLLSTSVGP